MAVYGKGWRPDTPDHRDVYYRAVAPVRDLPASVDLRSLLPPVYDQGALGACTAHGIAGAMQYAQAKQGFPRWMPSRLFIYYNEREMEGTIGQDAGASIRDGIKSINTRGVCYEEAWPYRIDRFAERPPDDAYMIAKNHPSVRYSRLVNLPLHLKVALAGGDVLVFGVSVYESFESEAVARSGDVPLPHSSERLMGGHCMLAVGYDGDQVLVRNSWGPAWGDGGYCRMPFAYLCNPDLADDFWMVQSVA